MTEGLSANQLQKMASDIQRGKGACWRPAGLLSLSRRVFVDFPQNMRWLSQVTMRQVLPLRRGN